MKGSVTPGWAVPGLLRALRLGPRGGRGRTLALLVRAEQAALLTETSQAELRGMLTGPERALARRAGTLVARAGLAPLGPDLVRLLARPGRRGWAARALRNPCLSPPIAALTELAIDRAAPLGARRVALELLAHGDPLDPQARARLLPALAEEGLHEPLLGLLRPRADERLLEAAIEANRAFGLALLEQRGIGPRQGLIGWLGLGPRSSSLGVWSGLAERQRGFLQGIAWLAIAARSRRWLPACAPVLFAEPALTAALGDAWVELELREVAPLLLDHLTAWGSRERRAVAIGLLGRLGAEQAKTQLRRFLPRFDRPAEQDEQAALVALGRLGDREAVRPFVDGTLLALAQAEGTARPDAGAPAHASVWASAFLAGAWVKDERVGQAALGLLRSRRPFPYFEAVLPEALDRLRPLELEPTLVAVLADPEADYPAWRVAAEVIRRARLTGLRAALVERASQSRQLAEEALRALRRLLGQPDDAELVRRLAEVTAPLCGRDEVDRGLARLLRRARTFLQVEPMRAAARAVLLKRSQGLRAPRHALRILLELAPDPAATREAVLLGLEAQSHAVRLRALRAGLARKLLDPARDGRLLPVVLDDALRAAAKDPTARAQVDLLLRGAARPFRARLLGAPGWKEPATFHGLHKELLLASRAGADVGLAHGGLLLLLAQAQVRDPKSGKLGAYRGPLPRLDEARAVPSPFVQEALVDVVLEGALYERDDALLASFLSSPLPRARKAALAHLSREGVLVHAEAVRARLADPAPAVRRAAIELLLRHELARFAPDLRPLLQDPEPGVQLAAGRALAAWGDAACLGLLTSFLGSTDESLRREALGHLQRAEPDAAAPYLAPLLRPATPRAAAAALCALVPGRLAAHAPLRAALLELAVAATGPLRAAALAFLPELARGGAAERCLDLLLDPDGKVRAAAGAALLQAGGRRHAPAVAALAARAPDATRRLELLALILQLDAPEAARGLLELLLDDDRRVREAARAAVHAARGWSLGRELAALLERGLSGKAGPAALAELVSLLDREGDEETVLPALVAALRCEERPVWAAALGAARGRGSDVLVEPIERLLEARRHPLPAPLVTLALGELQRCDLRRARPAVLDVLARAERETVRRKALETARRLEEEVEARPTAGLALQAATKAAEREEAALKAIQPGLLARLGGRDRRDPAKVKARKDAHRALRQVRGTRSFAGRLAVEAAPDLPALGRLLRELTPLQGTLPWRVLARAAELVAAGRARLADLPAGVQPLAVARAVRDAVEPARRVALLEEAGLPGNPGGAPGEWIAPGPGRGRSHDAPERAWQAWLIARLRTGRPPADAVLLERAVEDGWRQAALLGAAEGLAPELARLVPPIAAELRDQLKAKKVSPWQATHQATQLARARARLGVREGRDALLEVCDAGLGLLLLAADDDVAGLVAAFEVRAGIGKAGERARIVGLLGEVGSAEALGQVARRAADDAPAVRVAVAEELGRARVGPPEASRVILTTLLADPEREVRVAALRAAGRSGDKAHTGAVLAGLEASQREVADAAVEAARELGLAEACPALHAALRAGRARADLLAKALEALGGPEDARQVVERLRAPGLFDEETLAALTRLLVRQLPAERLDEVGLLLGTDQATALVVALRVLAARRHRAAAPAVRDRLRHPDAAVRAAAATALGELGEPADAPRLLRLAGLLPADPADGPATPAEPALAPILRDAGPAKIAVIKEVRAVYGLGLAEAKAMVDRGGPLPPLPASAARALQAALASVQAELLLPETLAGLLSRPAPAAAPAEPAQVRAAALAAATRLLPPAEALEQLLALVNESPELRLEAVRALARLAPEDLRVGARLLRVLTEGALPGVTAPTPGEPPAAFVARARRQAHFRPNVSSLALEAAREALGAILARGDEQDRELAWEIARAAASRPAWMGGTFALLEPWLATPRREEALDLLQREARDLAVEHRPQAVAAQDALERAAASRAGGYAGREDAARDERLAKALAKLEPARRRAWAPTLRELLLSSRVEVRRLARAALRELPEVAS